MAKRSTKEQYRRRATYGSLAYNYHGSEAYELPPEFPEREQQRAAEERFRREQRRSQEKRARQRAAAANKQAFPAFAVLGGLCVAVLLVFTMMARIQLTSVAATTADLQQQLSSLQVEQNQLRIQHEQTFNLSEVEEYALQHLGMQQPRSDQIYYIDSSVPDRAEVMGGDPNAMLTTPEEKTKDTAEADKKAADTSTEDTATPEQSQTEPETGDAAEKTAPESEAEAAAPGVETEFSA